MTKPQVDSKSDEMAVSCILKHYDELRKLLSLSPPTLESLTNKYYQAHYIDLAIVKSVISNSDGARTLLDQLILKVEQHPDYLPSVISIMETETTLADIVQKMDSDCNQKEPSIISPQLGSHPLMTHQPSLVDTAAEAEQLKQSFASLSEYAIESAHRAAVSVDVVKMKTGCLFQFQSLNITQTPELQKVMADLELNITSADEAIRFIINQNLLEYLNFMMTKYVLRSLFVLSSPNLVEMIDHFEKQHNHFASHNPLKNIASMLKQRPDLAPLCMAGLPEVRFLLNDSWKDRSLHQWNEMMADVGISPDHLMLKNIDIASGIISYAVVPFFISTVTRRLSDESVVKVLARAGVTFTADEDVWKIGSLENSHINFVIKQADTMIKNKAARSSHSTEPFKSVGHERSKSVLVPQPVSVSLEGGYDDEIFLSPPPKDFQCVVCWLTVREPHLIACCGAITCKMCMLRTDAKSECPQCRDKDHLVVPDKRTRGQTMSLKVQCTNGGTCSWRGELVDYTSHITERCPSRVVQCQYGCGLYYTVSDVAAHEEEECTKRPYDVIIGYYEKRTKGLEHRLKVMEEQKYVSERDHIEQVQSFEKKHKQQVQSVEKRNRQQVKEQEEKHRQEVQSIESKMKEQETELVKCNRKLVNLENMLTAYSEPNSVL